MWIGADDKGCSHDKREYAMWIGKDVKGNLTTNLR
jgi:hypothetical protein